MLVKGIYATREVFVDGKKLYPDFSRTIVDHSPDGFSWGYGGSGPAQLALALLLLRTSSIDAVAQHQVFKWECIANLPDSDFEANMDIDGFLSVRRIDICTENEANSFVELPKSSNSCSKGWNARCRSSHGKKCICKCGGKNHGKDVIKGNELSSLKETEENARI